MLTEEEIRNALRDCYDPEIPLNLVELGLVERIRLTLDLEAPGAGIAGVPERFAVEIALLATTRDEAAEAQMCAQVRNCLAGIFAVSQVLVTVAAEPVWTPARITAAGRRTLGMDQPQFPILNNKVRSL